MRAFDTLPPIDAVLAELSPQPAPSLERRSCRPARRWQDDARTSRAPRRAWVDGRKLILLEPRRLAARAAAERMAATLGEAVGERSGFGCAWSRSGARPGSRS